MLDPSPRLKKEAKKIGCDPNHIILADLILSGYSESEAYDIAYSENASLGAKKKIEDRERVLESDGYNRAFEEKQRLRKYASKSIADRSKDDVLSELNALASTVQDTKMKVDILKQIAEIKNMKKDGNSDEDPVQFFFPISCEKCPLLLRYNEMIATQNAGLPRDKWDLEVRPDEMQRLIEQADTDIRQMRKKEKAGY
jgi:hypothetical protein